MLVRYKQAVLGIAWAALQPLLTMIVFTVVFNRALGVKSPDSNIPYEVFTFAGLLPWQFFSGALARSGASLVGNANLLTKVYFPRLVIPISAVLAGLVDFIISFVVLLILMAAYGTFPSWEIVSVPLFLLLAILTALGVSLWLSALNVPLPNVQKSFLSSAVVDVHQPGDLFRQQHPRGPAPVHLLPEPHDWGDWGFPLGSTRAGVRRGPHMDLRRSRGGSFCWWSLLLQTDGTGIR